MRVGSFQIIVHMLFQKVKTQFLVVSTHSQVNKKKLS